MVRPPEVLAVPPHGGFFTEERVIDKVGSASAAGAATTTILEYAMPSRQRGVVFAFGQSVLDTDAWSNLTWRITVDGSTVENCLWTTRVGLIAQPTKVYVPLGPRQTVRVEIDNVAVGAFTACARIQGNFWPLDTVGLGTPENMTQGHGPGGR